LKKLLLLLICIPLASQELADVLWGKSKLASPYHYSEITNSIINIPTEGKSFKAILKVNKPPLGIGHTVLTDDNGIHLKDFEYLPNFEIEIISQDGYLYSINNEIIETDHPYWNIQFGTGTSKLEKESNNTVLAIPFSLIHKSANCTHNGVGIFSISQTNSISNIVFQVASETCAYYKFDHVSIYSSELEFTDSSIDIIKNDKSKNENILSIENLYEMHDLDDQSFINSNFIDPSHVTLFGIIDNNNHYTSSCITRLGDYPFCDQILLPSYSLAKSIAGTLTLALIEESFGTISDIPIASIVPECNDRKWANVTIENLSDMTTGQYFNSIHDYDESSIASSQVIFILESHKDKLKKACTAFPKKTRAGKRFVYHTSDTYILGTAFNNLLNKKSEKVDYFNDVLTPYLQENNLSQASKSVLRTYDNNKQAFTGWGMFFLRSDIFYLSKLIHTVKANPLSNLNYLHEALNPNEDISFKAIPSVNIFYNNGFWSRKFDKSFFGCSDDVWIPFMSGFGGITLAFFPNGMTYYYFSDGYEFAWESAIFSSHKIKPFC
tara:strand:- start:1113 stop:2768 length:1656 start_codon:yes stop_codon:yes gene_type:complete